jgi:hypothetical protein
VVEGTCPTCYEREIAGDLRDALKAEREQSEKIEAVWKKLVEAQRAEIVRLTKLLDGYVTEADKEIEGPSKEQIK